VLEIEDKVSAANGFFKQRRDSAGVLGFWMLAYGGSTDFLDEGLWMGESTALKTVKEFATIVVEVFGDEFLRPPSESELQHILLVNEACGFPGMIESLFALSWPSVLSTSALSLPCCTLEPVAATTLTTLGVLLTSSNVSFHFGSLRNIFQQCIKWNGSVIAYIFTASSIWNLKSLYVSKYVP
jgi:hypothetical protein